MAAAHALPFPSCSFELRHSKSLLPLATTAGQEGDHLAFMFFVIVSPQVHINIQYDVHCGFL